MCLGFEWSQDPKHIVHPSVGFHTGVRVDATTPFLSFFLSFQLIVFIFKLIAWVSHVGVRTVSFPASEEAPARLQRRVGPLLRHLYGLDRRIISFQKHSKMLRKLFYMLRTTRSQNTKWQRYVVARIASSRVQASTRGKRKPPKTGTQKR